MICIKTKIKEMPEYCDDCNYYGCRPHPDKGWIDICELMCECMSDESNQDWIYDGNGRPKKCPLIEIKESKCQEND